MLKDNNGFVSTEFKTGLMRMALNFQKLRLLASIFVQNINFIMIHAYISMGIQVVKKVKCLSVIFDKKKLSFVVRFKLDYDCIVYESARTSYFKALDAIHHRGLRLCLGVFEILQSTVCMSRQMNHRLI